MSSFKINPALTQIRKDYSAGILTEETVLDNPFHQFEAWLNDAFETGNEHANAMALSTVSVNGVPDSRIVLLRNISYGGFTFFTNYNSKKAKDLLENDKASLLFFWSDLERQVRIEGTIEKLPTHESDEYFESRPFESKVGAWVSQQSEVLTTRADLENAYQKALNNYKDKVVPRPAHWGGYVLLPNRFEFWQGRANRLHDRLRFTLELKNTNWKIERLMP